MRWNLEGVEGSRLASLLHPTPVNLIASYIVHFDEKCPIAFERLPICGSTPYRIALQYSILNLQNHKLSDRNDEGNSTKRWHVHLVKKHHLGMIILPQNHQFPAKMNDPLRRASRSVISTIIYGLVVQMLAAKP